MSADVAHGGTEFRSTPHARRGWWVGAAVFVAAGLVAVVVIVVGSAFFHVMEGRPLPSFPSLADHPDGALQGTVAYTDGSSRCVRIVAAAGQPSKDVLCLGVWKPPPSDASPTSKEMNAPQLVWRADGRLEVTMFLMRVGPENAGKAPGYTAEWQKVVDVRTGVVENVPVGELPATPDAASRPTTRPGGDRVMAVSKETTGEVAVTLSGPTGTRTLLSVHGPGEYSYRLYSAFWAPDWQWIAADDGRILVITPGEPPTTRVLVDGAGAGGDIPTFAVTARNLLTPTGVGLQAALKNALDTGTVTNLQDVFAPEVDYAIAASGSFGRASAAAATQLVASYLKNASGPWDFAIPPATLGAYQQGPYRRYVADDTYFAVSPGGFLVSVRVNTAGRIDQVFLAASADLLR